MPPKGENLPCGAPDDAQEDALAEHHEAVDADPLLTSEAVPDNAQDEVQQMRSFWYLVLLTVGVGGLQVAWSVEFSNGSPYLLSLGLSKSLMALVWMAGPLTGSLVVPYVGYLSDHCQSSWGRRKPFMIGGSAATIGSLLFLAWAREMVSGLGALFGLDSESDVVKRTLIVAAVFGVYVLDVSINTVQAALRAFIVDGAAAHQQEAANAMASRFIGIGNIAGFVAGYIDLPAHVGFLGTDQFKILCAIASIVLAVTIVLSSATISERKQGRNTRPMVRKSGMLAFFLGIPRSIKQLPPQTKRVCRTQLWAWIGFFPLLFYSSPYIGEIFVQPFLRHRPDMSAGELDELYEEATRIGSLALLVNAIVSLLTNILGPFLITPSLGGEMPKASHGRRKGLQWSLGKAACRRWQRWLSLEMLRIPGLTLKRAWVGSLVLFTGLMLCTPVVTSTEAATVLIGLAGVTWAMALWAPWAMIGAEISRRDSDSSPAATEDAAEVSMATQQSRGGESVGSNAEAEVDRAGVILGIHNMAIAVPQIVATVGSSIIFSIWQKPRGTAGDYSISIVMALGGVCVLVASCLAAGIKEVDEDESVCGPRPIQVHG